MRRKVVAWIVLIVTLAGACGLLYANGSVLQLGEKDITVHIEVDGVVVANYTVNIFNNAYIPDEPEAPQGYSFAGWSSVRNWTEGVDADDLLIEGKLIRYTDVKDVAVKDEVTLYPVFREKESAYFVLGWYSRTKTSGLDEETMAPLEEALKQFLREQGATEEQIAQVEVRGYGGDVAAMGAAVRKDGDVDVIIGVGNNVDAESGTTAGLTTYAKSKGFTINGKEKRRVALLTNTELSIKVYNWLQSYIEENFDPTFEPKLYGENVPDDTVEAAVDPTKDKKLVVLWYGKTKTSGCSEEDMTRMETELRDYLTAAYGISADEVLVLKSTDGNIASLVDEVQSLSRVDMILGVGKNVSTTAGKKSGEVLDVKKISGKFSINDVEGRRLALLNDEAMAQDAYQWILKYAKTHFGNTGSTETKSAADYTKNKKLVVLWYGRTKTSGCTEEDMEQMEEDLKAYLSETYGIAAGDILVMKSTDGNVAALVDQVQKLSRVDLILGVGNNISTTVGKKSGEVLDVKKISGKFSINNVEGRRLALLNDEVMAQDAYQWILEYAKTHFGNTPSAEPQPAVDYTKNKKFVVLWYGRTKTSGCTETDMAQMEADLKTYLSEAYGIAAGDVLVMKSTDGSVAALVDQVQNLSRVDLIFGVGSNIGTTAGKRSGKTLAVQKISEAFLINGVGGRRLAQIGSDAVAEDAYQWILKYVKSHFGNIEEPDQDETGDKKLVLVWYGRTGTSGCTEEDMAKLDAGLKDYLSDKGIAAEDVLVIKSTDGNIGALVDEVQSLSRVDLILGAGGNIGTTKGSESGETLDVKTLSDAFVINGVEGRRLALLGDDTVAEDAYRWILNYFGVAADPEPEPDVTENKRLVLVWYGRTGTSGCTEEDMAKLDAGLKDYLSDKGIAAEDVLVIKSTDGNIGALVDEVQSLSRVDLILGAGGNIGTTKGSESGETLDVKTLSDAFVINGVEGRRLALLGDDTVAEDAYRWVLNYFGVATEPGPIDPDPTEPDPAEPDPDPDVTKNKQLVLMWYGKTGTSGCTEEDMAKLDAGLKDYLFSKGIAAEDVLVVKSTDGNIGALVDEVQSLSRVDLILGAGGNIGTTKGSESGETLDVKTLSDAFVINGVEGRRLALLGDDAVAEDAYRWVLNYFGVATEPGPVDPDPTEPDPAEPDPDPDVTKNKKLVLVWYGRTGTSGCTEEDMAKLDAGLKDYLSGKGITAEDVLVIKSTDGNIGALVDEVQNYSRVDLILGVGTNIGTTKGTQSGQTLDVKSISDGFTINGVEGRRLALLDDDAVAKDAYQWILEYAKNHFGNTAEPEPTEPEPAEPDPDPDVTKNKQLVLMWYGKTGTSGCTAADMEQLDIDLKAYLSEKHDIAVGNVLVMQSTDGNIGALVDEVQNYSRVDLILGVGTNISTTKGTQSGQTLDVKSISAGFTINGVTGRRLALLGSDAVAEDAYQWVLEYAKTHFGNVAEPEQNSDVDTAPVLKQDGDIDPIPASGCQFQCVTE